MKSRDIPNKSNARRFDRMAFTLVEVLVSIGIIGLLLAILLPALAGAKRAGVNTAMLVNQRESMGIVRAYASDHDDQFPSAGDESGVTASFPWQGTTQTLSYWAQPDHWGWIIQSLGYEGYVSVGPNAAPTIFRDQEDCTSCGFGMRSIHTLSPTVLAEPEQFADGASADRLLNTAQRTTDVRHPAAKGVLMQMYARDVEDASSQWLIHFADGHGEYVPERRLRPGAEIGIPFGGLPVMSTVGGVEGRDL